ncbi:Sulfotransferase family protein [Sinosporangium album]|uniref:Sulfotransferase family protein n=1 Tax=Sinosporangium album TaxID=504805 RepID=A0A1G8J1P8_9ACTN|nr:sulfotransferase [Sinosporangium album]SDI24983.1 Sulfotransferase family protein [Sinosporangium album]
MKWQRRINKALVAYTGYQLKRSGKQKKAESAKANRDAIRPAADPESDRLLVAPVFIMCPVRSGSTLLRSVLNAHSQLHAPHELHVRRLTVGLGTRLARQAMTELGHNQADLEHLLWDRVLHRELSRSGKRYIVEKTPANAFVHERIATCWPDARFIFLLRHPASIAASWYEADPHKRNREEAAADALRYMKAVHRARKALPGLTVHYENLTADPEHQTQAICDFLGIEWEPSMLQYGRPDVIRKGLGDWKDKIASGSVQPGRGVPAPEEIPEVLTPMCEAWGYLPGRT